MVKTLEEALYTHDPVICKRDTPLVEVARMIKEHEVGAVIITDEENQVEGIFTERDWIMKIAPNQSLDISKALVKNHMTKNPKCIKRDQRLEFIFGLMRMCNFGHLVVVDDDNRAIGIFSIMDAFYILCDEAEKDEEGSIKV